MANIATIKSWYDDPNEVIFTGQGSCHSIDSDAPYNVIDELRATVEEITGYSAPRQAMGFDLTRR